MFPQLYELICIYTYNIYRCLKKQIKENADQTSIMYQMNIHTIFF